MDRLAKETGGMPVDAKETDPHEYFRLIAEELRTSYEVGYYPSGKNKDEGFRKISVKSKLDGVKIRTKTGYFVRTRIEASLGATGIRRRKTRASHDVSTSRDHVTLRSSAEISPIVQFVGIFDPAIPDVGAVIHVGNEYVLDTRVDLGLGLFHRLPGPDNDQDHT